MKIPEKAPQGSAKLESISLFTSGKLNDFLSEANREYLYWDKVKYRKITEGVNIKDAWYCLKLSRKLVSKPVGLKDRDGKPFTFWNTDRFLQYLSDIDKYAAGQILSEEFITSKLFMTGHPSPPSDEKSWFPPKTRETPLRYFHGKGKDLYIRNSLMEESIASSVLEGAVSTRKAAKQMLKSGRKPRDHSERMIANNYRTVLMVKELSGKPLSVELLNRLHASMTEDTLENRSDSGKVRATGDEVDVVDEQGTLLHTGIPAEQLPEHLDRLCRFANQQEEDIYIHPVIKAIMLHFALAYIHPYMDGNGRCARALFYWYLLSKEYWLIEYLSISRMFLKARSRYHRAFLYTEMDGGDLNYFIHYHLEMVIQAIDQVTDHIKRKQKEIQKLTFTGLNYRQQDILRYAVRKPETRFTIYTHQVHHGVVYQTARTDLLDLVDRGYLRQLKIGRAFYFEAVFDLARIIRES